MGRLEVTLGAALMHRQSASERDRGQQLLVEVSDAFERGATTWAIYRGSMCTWHVKGLGVEIATTLYR